MMKKIKNGFTLIELLAVIVILAIITAIATPIILSIIDDARKDTFLRSVELVISTTNIDVKNTQGMYGNILYDTDGKVQYAVYNDKYCVIKTGKMYKPTISAKNGECILTSAINQLYSQVSNENDTIAYANGQLINLGNYGIRYQGANPDNYIYFNCEDYSNQSHETCEIWRIIGIVDGKIKIIGNEIGSQPWDYKCDENNSNCTYKANWNNASLKLYLNGLENDNYFGSLTEATKLSNFISPSTWYLKTFYDTTQVINKNVMYDLERSTGKVFENNPEFIENTKIGIMYPSDWVFAAMDNQTCDTNTELSNFACKSSNWINLTTTRTSWLLSPSSIYSYGSFAAETTGVVYYAYDVNYSLGVRPVLYLSNDIEFAGNGTQEIPYRIN